MLGRPVLLSIAAAIASLVSVTGASASCYSCGCNAAPVVYSYATPCASYAAPPMYIVNQGPAYTLPVPIAAEPTPAYSYPYVGHSHRYYGAERYYGDVYPRMHRRHHHWRASYGYDRGYRLDRGFRLDRFQRHHGRPHIGMRHFAHIPRAHMHMQRQFRHMNMHRQMHMRPHMHMQMRPQMRGPAPGFVHPRKKW